MSFEKLELEFSSGIPVYKQIVHFISIQIDEGRWVMGDQLPTIRELAKGLGINPNTVAKAFRELELTGVIDGKCGKGSFVAEGRKIKLSDEKKNELMTEMEKRFVSEVRGYGLSPQEVLEFLMKRKDKWAR